VRSWLGRSLIGNFGGGTGEWAVVLLRLVARECFVDCYVPNSLQIKTCCSAKGHKMAHRNHELQLP
jgi:hypothetical protein